jgi:hypothetical protein
MRDGKEHCLGKSNERARSRMRNHREKPGRLASFRGVMIALLGEFLLVLIITYKTLFVLDRI